MSAERDWEKTLREHQYDLPAQTWQRMENDMRGWLASQARQAQTAPLPNIAPWWAAWLRPSRWGIALAGLALAGVVVHHQSRGTGALEWEAGQAKVFDGGKKIAWDAARCEVQGTNARLSLAKMDAQSIQLRMEQGLATFHVQPRRAGETFQVDLGRDCQVQVVGTVFTVGADSLNAWVAVQEGRVRLQAAGEGQFVDQGAKAHCPETGKVSTGPGPQADSAKTVEVPQVAVDVASKPGPAQVEMPSCNEPGPCVTILSKFVREHSGHPAVSEIALRWGRLAARGGDPRDALVGYSHVKSPVLKPVARLESLALRSREFGESSAVADSLDRWLSKLKSEDPIFKPVAQLRIEIYRRQGNDSGARSLEERISGSATAQTRGR